MTEITGSTERTEPKPVEELSFREAMLQLEEIVGNLESNTSELEESLDIFARGVQLVGTLRGRLNDAQQTIDVLKGQLEAPDDDDSVDTQLHKA